jgi:hypothetical protein
MARYFICKIFWEVKAPTAISNASSFMVRSAIVLAQITKTLMSAFGRKQPIKLLLQIANDLPNPRKSIIQIHSIQKKPLTHLFIKD